MITDNVTIMYIFAAFIALMIFIVLKMFGLFNGRSSQADWSFQSAVEDLSAR